MDNVEIASGVFKASTAEARLREVNNIISNFKYESKTVIHAILSVSELHMGTQNLPAQVEAALAKINDSGKLLDEIVSDALVKLEIQTSANNSDVLPKANLPKKIQKETTSERRVVPVRMPYGNVMIVDDLELNLRVTKGLLEFYDVSVDTALNPQTIIDKVISGAVYDIILMDLMMPELDGITAMRTLRKLGYAMPIVAFTANKAPEHDAACIKQGFDGVLGKPVQIPELDDMLHKFIRNRHSMQAVKKAEENQPDDTKETKSPEEKPSSKGCILLVGEDVELLSSVSKILSKFYSVKATRKIKDAISIVKKHEVDMIILDVSADDEDYRILDKIKSNEKVNKLPVIVISKNASASDEARALVGGAVDYLRKPLKDEILTLRVELHMQLLKRMRSIELLSLVDGLTGINNRRSYNIVFENEWKRAARARTHISLLMIDIDKFKLFNDTYGHLCGDAVLKNIAKILVSSVKRGSDYVFRWGGEEFAVVLPDTPSEGAYFVAESIRANIENAPIVYGGKSYKITVSIGASSVIPDYSNFYDDSCSFLNIVDKALYAAKDQGRNRVVKLTL